MRWIGKYLFVFLATTAAAAVLAPAAQAQQRDIEITPFAGVRWGGYVDLASGPQTYESYRFKDSVNYGGMLDVTLAPDLLPNLEGEFMWNRQSTELSSFVNGEYQDVGSSKLDQYQFGLLYQFGAHESRFHPFIVGGLGFENFRTNGVMPFNNRFAFNLGGGVKYFFTRHVGLRAEVRYSPSQTTSYLATYCDPYYGCYQATSHNYLQQGQANLGVIIRF
jgi:opacity protein-like surface antigen